jgi:hypothetical protein
MNFSISARSSKRALRKLYGRLSPKFRQLEEEIENASKSAVLEDIFLTITDEPGGSINKGYQTDAFFVDVGLPSDFSLTPSEDDTFLEFIIDSSETAIQLSSLNEKEKESICSAIEKWKVTNSESS